MRTPPRSRESDPAAVRSAGEGDDLGIRSAFDALRRSGGPEPHLRTLVPALLAFSTSVVTAREDPDCSELENTATRFVGNVCVLDGAGGKIAAWVGGDGIAIVDDPFDALFLLLARVALREGVADIDGRSHRHGHSCGDRAASGHVPLAWSLARREATDDDSNLRFLLHVRVRPGWGHIVSGTKTCKAEAFEDRADGRGRLDRGKNACRRPAGDTSGHRRQRRARAKPPRASSRCASADRIGRHFPGCGPFLPPVVPSPGARGPLRRAGWQRERGCRRSVRDGIAAAAPGPAGTERGSAWRQLRPPIPPGPARPSA